MTRTGQAGHDQTGHESQKARITNETIYRSRQTEWKHVIFEVLLAHIWAIYVTNSVFEVAVKSKPIFKTTFKFILS